MTRRRWSSVLDDAIFLNDLPGNDAAGSPPDEVIPIPFRAAAGQPGYRVAIFDEGSSPPPGDQAGTAPQTPIALRPLSRRACISLRRQIWQMARIS